MITKAANRIYYVLFIVLVISLFFSQPTVSATPDVGLSVSGPLLNQTYFVTHGQIITGQLTASNTGGSDATFDFTSEISSGPSGSVKVKSPPISPNIVPLGVIQTNWSFVIQNNASGVVTVRISITATGSARNGSIAQASISGFVYFVIDPNALVVRVRVIDKYDWPIENAEIELVHGFISYTQQATDKNGTTKFQLSRGYYMLRCFVNGFLEQTATLNITENQLFTFQVSKGLVIIEPPLTVNLVDFLAWFGFGYLCKLVRDRREHKRREHPKSEFEYWMQWSEGDLS